MAVRGIAEHGLPILPSGLLYDRGILYSYASWIAHAVTGSELPAYRAISFICAMLSLWLIVKFLGRLHGYYVGLIGAGLVAIAVPFWATATTARFYAPFLTLYLATLLSLSNAYLLVVLALMARLTHELAFTLAAVPIICWLVDRDRRHQWWRATVAIVAGLVLGQLLLVALHWLAPADGNTMVRRFFLWQVVNLFERPGDRQFAIPIVVAVVAWIVAPKRAWTIAVVALSVSAAIFAFSIAQASNTAPVSLALISTVAIEGSRYPLDMFWHLLRTMPIVVIAVMGMLFVRARYADLFRWRRAERGLHALWIGWVLWFGVIESGITTNYLLLPVTFMLMTVANDALYLAILETGQPDPGHPGWLKRNRWQVLGVAVFAIIFASQQWQNNALQAARPTIVADGITDIKNTLQPHDRVVCTDELGCLMLVGRIDRWLALDDYVRERFLVRRGDGPVTGVYTGVPAVFRPADLFDRNADGTLPDRVVIVDIFKDYPIGNSRSWLPKAIEQDGVKVVPLLETPQLRVLEISAAEHVVRAGY